MVCYYRNRNVLFRSFCMPIIKDEFGIQLKYPDRKCTECRKYPCMQGFEVFKCNMAAYGCRDYYKKEDKKIKNSDDMENT